MKKIKTTIGTAALVVSLAACTPNQIAFWMQARAEVAATPDPADDIALQQAFDNLPETPNTSCAQWYWWAIEAGFTHDQWMSPLSRIMRAESNCDPNAHNPSGATGLTQVMPMWIDDCGGGDLRDPMFNLRCAHHIWEVQGWGAWVTY
jgi:Transglycosylase SLT domain